MTRKLTRRDFIKTAGIGAAATAVLTGCGPMSRYVVREPYTRMPEYTYNGQSTYYATTCRECPAGCGTVVRTEQGRALKVEGNPLHPVNQGKTCSRGQASLQGLYNPDRIEGPYKKYEGLGRGTHDRITWDEAIGVVQNALQSNLPGQVAFLLGMVPDHLFDMVSELCASLGAPAPLRYGAHEIFDARLTLMRATRTLFSASTMPYFDLANTDVIFSFGANFLETYQSPLAQARGYAHMRRGVTGRRGMLVQFEPRLSQTAAVADQWVPVVPGTEGFVAQAIGQLAAQVRGSAIPNIFLNVNPVDAATMSGVPLEELHKLAETFAKASHPLAIPGGATFGLGNGLESAQAVLALNALVDNLGVPGGMYLNPDTLVNPDVPQLPNSMRDVNDLVLRMQRGEVKTLFIHGFNPVFEIPAGLGFSDSLEKVPLVVSFASYPDETSLLADYILPDHTGLESWGYQMAYGADRVVVSSFQPAVAPFYDTRATADVLLAAVRGIGSDLAASLPYKDEVEYIQNKLAALVTQEGYFNAAEIKTFMAKFQQYGGWWSAQPGLQKPDGATALDQPYSIAPADDLKPDEFYLYPFMSPVLGEGGANKPWLQETPDPTTTVMWNSWVEINPTTAYLLELENDDVVKLITEVGEIEASVYLYPAIRPDTIAISFGQGHTAYGRYAEARGANPADLLSLVLNGADDLAFGATRVKLQKTGRKRLLSRYESRMGVYGEGLGE